MTMLNPPEIVTKAIWKISARVGDYLDVNPDLEENNHYIRLEEWKYSPELFAERGNVDPISLYCTLKDSTDERVLGELESLIGGIQWE